MSKTRLAVWFLDGRYNLMSAIIRRTCQKSREGIVATRVCRGLTCVICQKVAFLILDMRSFRSLCSMRLNTLKTRNFCKESLQRST